MPRISKLATSNNNWTSGSLLTRPLMFEWSILRFLSPTNCQRERNGSTDSWMLTLADSLIAGTWRRESLRVSPILRQGRQTQSKEAMF